MRRLFLLSVFVVLATPAEAEAFDYLEHLWFTDDACRRVQEELAQSDLSGLEARYAALALACPASWKRPYCEDGRKGVRGHLNELPSVDSRGYSATLGDFSALADHVSQQGPVRNLGRAGEHGLVHHVLRWLTASPRSVRGPIGDVAEAACKTRGLDDFDGVVHDVDAMLDRWAEGGRLESVPRDRLGSLQRGPLNQGPHDPPMLYSFHNPHYLDLVLRNHHHFGVAAHDAWNGFHSTATQMLSMPCSELLAADADRAADLAEDVSGFESIDWNDVPEDELANRVCGMLGEVVRRRLLSWASRAPSRLVEPLVGRLSDLRSSEPGAVLETSLFLDRVVVALLSLVFEGTGLHYIQDGLAAGHMRTIRSREALVEVRHDHDADNRDGVTAVVQTHSATATFVAWGDGYMLGSPPAGDSCDPGGTKPADVSTCLLRHQRGLIAAASVASLVDWAIGGEVYDAAPSCEGPLRERICIGLPLRAPSVAGGTQPEIVDTGLQPGPLPVPPPNFSYESFSVAMGYAPWETTPFLSLRFAAFAELDIPAHWLTSWQVRFESRFGDASQALLADLGYGFHYRLYARVMLDLVPVAFTGLRDFGEGPNLFAGLAPHVGFTFLPEGWVKIPIEFSLYVDQPIVFFSTDGGAFTEFGDYLPRAGVGFGLAFMH